MTDEEIAELIADLHEMAERVGARFIPDPDKIKAYRQARDKRVSVMAS